MEFKCDECEQLFESLDKLQNHKKYHSATRGEFICDVCNARLTTKSNLTTHLKNVHGSGERVLCICGISFKNQHSLACHISKGICTVGQEKKAELEREKAEEPKLTEDIETKLIDKWKELAIEAGHDPESVVLAPWEEAIENVDHPLAAMSKADCLAKLNLALETSETSDGCLIATAGSAFSKSGHRGIWFNSSQPVGFHQLVALLKYGRTEMLSTITSARINEASHLCSKASCFNYSCMVVESKALNQSRIYCNKVQRCVSLHDGVRCILPLVEKVITAEDKKMVEENELLLANQELLQDNQELRSQIEELRAENKRIRDELQETLQVLDSVDFSLREKAQKSRHNS